MSPVSSASTTVALTVRPSNRLGGRRPRFVRLTEPNLFGGSSVPRNCIDIQVAMRSCFVPMPVETLGEALQLGWRVIARCARGKQDGMHRHRECIYRAELDMKTLVRTRGLNFPLSRLESRLMCPRCGSRHIVLLFSPLAGSARLAAKSA
jgi:hypothetical protein